MPPRYKKNNFPLILIGLGGVLLLSAAITLAIQTRPGVSPTPPPSDYEEETYPNIQRVSIDDAKAAFDGGEAVFLDVRGTGAFEAGRVPGSLLIPIKDIETRWSELDPEDWIITYCT